MARSARATKESMTSSAATSITIPRNRSLPTRSAISWRSSITSRSERSDWIEAIR
jgi:hypothetical protein